MQKIFIIKDIFNIAVIEDTLDIDIIEGILDIAIIENNFHYIIEKHLAQKCS